MEEIRQTYEGEARMEAERNLMKIILPELQRNILASRSKMQEEFSRQMEEKDGELETLIFRAHRDAQSAERSLPDNINEHCRSRARATFVNVLCQNNSETFIFSVLLKAAIRFTLLIFQ